MTNKIVLITGANRGIGLELTKQYLAIGHKVVGTCRGQSQGEELFSLKKQYADNFLIESLDIAVPEQIENLASKFNNDKTRFDLIINNAGYLDRDNQSIHNINYAHAEMSLKVNSLGPLYLSHCFLPLMNKQGLSKIAIISSDMGSLTSKQNVAWYGYRMSKAAVNMLAVNLSQELQDKNIAVVAIHPGWVKTDMGGATANENVEDSALGIMQVIVDLSIDSTGGFYDFNNHQLAF